MWDMGKWRNAKNLVRLDFACLETSPREHFSASWNNHKQTLQKILAHIQGWKVVHIVHLYQSFGFILINKVMQIRKQKSNTKVMRECL
jgi:hypothetical protein